MGPDRSLAWRAAACLLVGWSLVGCQLSSVKPVTQPPGDGPPAQVDNPTPPPTSNDPPPGESQAPQQAGQPAQPALSITGVSAGEDAGTMVFSVGLARAASAEVSAQYATADGTAKAGTDYHAATGTLRFAAGSAEPLRLSVTVVDDALPEEAETFTVQLSNVLGAELAVATATGTIVDDDGSPGLSIHDASAPEDAGNIHFPVTLSMVVAETVTVGFATSAGTATGTDYTTTSGTLTLAAGVRAGTITVAIADDAEDEHTESFTVTLSNPSGASLVDDSATGSILDDDDDHGDAQQTATLVVPATAATAQDPISGDLETVGDVDYFKVVVDAGQTVHAIIDPATQHANLARRAYVTIETGGYSSSNTDGYDAAAVSSDATVYLRVWAPIGAPSYDLAIWQPEADDAEDTTFDIELTYSSTTKPSASEQSVLRSAADYWESVITDGLQAQFIHTSDLCGNGATHDFGSFVDDLHIDIRVQSLGGAGGVVASTKVCAIRRDGRPPWTAVIVFDAADLGGLGSNFRAFALHEMGHALGFGSTSAWSDLVVDSAIEYQRNNPASTTLPDAHFTGTAAVSAFNELAASYTGAKVPVENDTQSHSGSALDNHWRESVFHTEVMDTTIALLRVEKISKVTIAALADLGYRVDYTKAESYALPGSLAAGPLLHIREQVHPGPEQAPAFPEQDIPVVPP